jgi:hypothetical protein
MSQKELDLPRRLVASEKSLEKAVELTPLDILLNEVFEALNEEVKENGNSERFKELQQKYAQRILAFWQGMLDKYDRAIAKGKVKKGEYLREEKESLLATGYCGQDQGSLEIHRGRENGTDFFWIRTGCRGFTHPPRLTSRFDSKSDKIMDVVFEVYFSNEGREVDIARITTYQGSLKRVEVVGDSGEPFIV